MWNEIFDEQKYVFFHLYANVVMVSLHAQAFVVQKGFVR